MQRLFLPIITFIVATYLVGCGGGTGTVANSGDNVPNNNSIEIDKALKNKISIKLHVDFDFFQLSQDGTKIYGISRNDENFLVVDIRKIYHWHTTEDGETIYEFREISRLKIDLPSASDTTEDESKPNQTLSAIQISPDGKTAYLIAVDPRSGGGIGTLIIVDISNPKNPKVVNKDTINRYFDGIKVSPNGKYLFAMTSTDNSLATDLTIIDIQDTTKPKVLGEIRKGEYSMDAINALSLSNDGKRAYLATDNSIEVINLEDPTLPIRIYREEREYISTLGIVVTKNRKRMYVNEEKELQVFDIEDDKMAFITSYQINGDGHYDEIENLTLSDDENTLYATCSDEETEPNNSLVVFDISDKDKLVFKKKILAPSDSALTYDVSNQALAPDGKKFYTLETWMYIINLEPN